jgi:hypothetical protein
MDSKLEESNVMNTEKVMEIIEKEKYSLKLKRFEYIWYNGKQGIRKDGVSFAMTKEERDEYVKCKLSVFYFAQKYCQIKREDGTVGEIELRDYQKNIIKLINDNRYSIIMASRQSGKCVDPMTIILILDNDDNIIEIPIGILYYQMLIKERKLTFIEKTKYNLYRILNLISNKKWIKQNLNY